MAHHTHRNKLCGLGAVYPQELGNDPFQNDGKFRAKW